MKKNHYFTRRNGRVNLFQNGLLLILSSFASYARILLEVFTRKNFGHRYFKFSTACTVFILLVAWPFVALHFQNSPSAKFMRLREHPYDADASAVSLFPQYLTWYIFLAVFLYFSYQRHLEVRRRRNCEEPRMLSTYQGKVDPLFLQIKIPGIVTDARSIECYFEPAVFFIAGMLLYVIGQSLGGLLMICSIIYCASYISDYKYGNDYITNLEDEMIINDQFEDVFLNDKAPEDSQGVETRFSKPKSKDVRRKILPLIVEDEEIVEAK